MEFQQQPTPDTCTSACLAMITGLPVSQVIEEYDHLHKAHESNPCKYLLEKGVPFVYGSIYEQMRVCGTFLLCVPSLNIQGGNHNIIFRTWYNPDDGYYYKQLLDPARGREGRRYYVVEEPQNELEVALVSYIVELTIPDGGV